MKISLPSCTSVPFSRLIQLSCLIVLCGCLSTLRAANPTMTPVLLSEATSTRAIAFESVTMRPEPFPVTSSVAFSADTRTRVAIFAMNLDLLAGEGASAFTADAEDGVHTRYPMNVEFVGPVPGFPGITMIIVRLNDAMGDLGDVLVRLNLHGTASNRVRIAVGHVGGGLPDDNPGVFTPAPATPPPAPTPLTLAQYQAQFSDPAFPNDQDIRRFLEQATWGPKGDASDFQHVRTVGMQAYITEQFNTPPLFVDAPTNLFSNYPATPLYPEFYPASPPAAPCDSSTTCFRDNYTLYPLQKQFVTNALTQTDQLRQRVAFAL